MKNETYSFPREEEPTTTTTSTRATTTTTRKTTTTTRTTPTTTTKKYCPPGGEWTDWDENPKYCGDFCGAAGNVTRTRKCLSNSWGCPCTGPSFYNYNCEVGVCYYPRYSCVPGLHAGVFDSRFLCSPLPPIPVDIPKPPGYCPSHGLGIWSQWSYFGTCSSNCGLCGTQTRTRSCISPANCRCVGQGSETRSCPGVQCPGDGCCRGYKVTAYDGFVFCREVPQTQCQGTWTAWSRVQPVGANCSATCGGCGFGIGARFCYPAGCQCPGSFLHPSLPCPSTPCKAPKQPCCAPYHLTVDRFGQTVCG